MKRIFCFLLALFCALLASCSKKDATVEAVLERIYDELSPVPAGELYLSTSAAGTRHFISPALFCSLYGDGKEVSCAGAIEEYALYLSSFSAPFEIAVFKCYSPSDTEKVERMCVLRLDALRRYFSTAEHKKIIDSAVVIRDGRFVVMALGDTEDDLLGTVKGALP